MWVAGDLDSRLAFRPGTHGPDELCPYVKDVTESSSAHSLGLHLGDGCISTARRSVQKLRVFQDDRYPNLIHQRQIAMQ